MACITAVTEREREILREAVKICDGYVRSLSFSPSSGDAHEAAALIQDMLIKFDLGRKP